MTLRWRSWLGVSALAMASGALPAASIVSPMARGLTGLALIDEAQAQESGDGTDADCTTGEDGEGEEGAECPAPSGEEGDGEDADGEDGEGG